jgi:hypothetical protein
MNRKEKQLLKELDLAIASVTRKYKIASRIAWVLWLFTFVAWIIFFVIIFN